MQYISMIGNAVTNIPTSIGNLTEAFIDGRFGIGACHQKLLSVGGDRVLMLAVSLGLPCIDEMSIREYEEEHKKCNHTLLEHRIFHRFVCSTVILFFLSTEAGFKPLTSEMCKSIYSKTALFATDSFAISTLFIDEADSSKSAKAIAGLYLSARALDLLVNFGAVTENLVRFNPQPFFANINTVKSWF
jgi:hypothetical protein